VLITAKKTARCINAPDVTAKILSQPGIQLCVATVAVQL